MSYTIPTYGVVSLCDLAWLTPYALPVLSALMLFTPASSLALSARLKRAAR
ncbi:hypothetical protein D3C81_2182950 [compost metagenome]